MKHGKGFVGLVLFLAAALLAVWPAAGASAQAKEVVIGYTGPISGIAAEYGQDGGHGIEMAIADMNQAGGIAVKGQKYKVKLVKLDEILDPTASVNNCRRLRDQYKTPAIIPCSIPSPPWPKSTRKRGMNS